MVLGSMPGSTRGGSSAPEALPIGCSGAPSERPFSPLMARASRLVGCGLSLYPEPSKSIA